MGEAVAQVEAQGDAEATEGSRMWRASVVEGLREKHVAVGWGRQAGGGADHEQGPNSSANFLAQLLFLLRLQSEPALACCMFHGDNLQTDRAVDVAAVANLAY